MTEPIAPWLTPSQSQGWLARRWKLLVGLLLAFLFVLVAAVGGIIWLFISSTRGSVVAKAAMAKARSNSTVVQQVGTPIEEGWSVSSSMKFSGDTGDAELRVPISGPKGRGTVHVIARKENGLWTYSMMQVEFEGVAEKTDLLAGSTLPEPDASTPAVTPASTPVSDHTYSFHFNLTWLVILFLLFLAYRRWHKFRSPAGTLGDAVGNPVGNASPYAPGMPRLTEPPPVLGAGGIFGLVFQSLIGLVFAVVGLYMLAPALGLTRSPVKDPSVLYAGILCSFLGLGLIFWGAYVASRTVKLKMRRAKYPAEPWLWREDWARGRAYRKIGAGLVAGWSLAGFFNLTLLVLLHSQLTLEQEVHKSGAGAYMILCIPLFGAIALIYAIRETIRYFEFRTTYFEMSSLPAVLGGELKGVIQARFPHSPDHGIHLRLSCIGHYYGGRSDNSSLLWRDEANLSSMQLYPGVVGTSIPVAFRIPLDAKPTEQLSTSSEIVWRLEALADVPAVKYRAIFEVPVFRTQPSLGQMQAGTSILSKNPVTVAVAQPSPTDSIPGEKGWAEVIRDAGETGHIGEMPGTFGTPEVGHSISRPDSLSFEVRQTADGTEFYFPASRNRRSAILMTGVTLFCGAFTVVSLLAPMPIFAQLFVGLFTVLAIYGTMQTWVGNTRIVIGNGSLTLRSSLLGSGKVRQVPLSEIASIRAGIGATDQAGDSLNPIYFVELAQRDGKKLGLAQFRNKHEVEWLLQEIHRLAGLPPKR